MITRLLLLATLAHCGVAPEPPGPPPFSAAALWDDGRAEVATYDAERVIYGAARPHEAVLIVVKEDLDPAALVKDDAPDAASLPVLKLNVVAEAPTPNYPYRFLASAFLRRDDPAVVVKTTISSQEWCGNTFQLLARTGRGARLHWHSYFDGEADGEERIALPGDALVTVALPVQLRALPFRAGLEQERTLLDLDLSNRAADPALRRVRVAVDGPEPVATPLGALEAWRVRVVDGAAEHRYWFETAAPHLLVAMERADGATLRLKARTRAAYWER